MGFYKKYISIGVLLFIVASTVNCSTQRNNLVNRNLHKLSTKYNVLFNGNEALNKELMQMDATYHDNFFDLLSVEKFDAEYEIFIPGQEKTSANLERAEEKAVKAIQKHSMDIHGVQENSQIDNAYLLLGKTRYYQKRFLAALDAFNYVLDNDFRSDIRPLIKLWQAKSDIRMENYHKAIRNLKFLGNNKSAPNDVRAEANAYLGQALIDIDSLSSAVKYLELAAELSKSKENKARYHFIAAQLLDRTSLKDSAVQSLRKIEAQKRPRKYSLQAELYRYHLSLDKTEQHPEMLKALYKKLKRYEYHKFYPYINYEIGEIFHSEDSLQTAVDYYTKAARSDDKQLKEKAYEQMVSIGFYKKDYLMAGAYLDSLLAVMPHETLKYLKTQHKRNNIDDIIVLEKRIKHNDSIMQLVNADSLGRVKIIQAYIDKLRADEAKSVDKTQTEDYSKVKPKYTSFYFYNKSLASKGAETFEKKWGKMSLADMWRLSNKMSFDEDEDSDNEDADIDNTDAETDTAEANIPDKYKVSFYYKKIPTKKKVIDSILGETNYSHYQVGMIYYEKFKELEKAQENLEKMLAENPKEELIAPAKYNLHKIYNDLGKNLIAENLASEILNDYPNSIYADLIKNPDKISERSNKAFQTAYHKLYELYKVQKFDSLLNLSEPMLRKFSFHPELGKVELLRATALAKTEGVAVYEKALEDIIIKYPKSKYEEEAKKRMTLAKKYNKMVYTTAKSNSYKVVIPFDIFSSQSDAYIDCIKQVLAENKSEHLKISKDPFTRKQSFVVVHNFLSEESAKYLTSLLAKTSCRADNNFVISSDNYKMLQLTKKLKEYKAFINK